MSKLVEARNLVTKFGWLSRQPTAFRDSLLNRCKLRAFDTGQKLYGLDDRPGGVFGLAEGYVDVLLASGSSSPFLCFIGGPGWWVGEAAAGTGTSRRVEICARTAALAFELPASEFGRITAENPEAWRCFAELTVDHMDNALMLASTMAAENIHDRVASTLYRLAGAYRASDETIELPCTQREIAEMAGLSRNSVGPVMRTLANARLVHYGRGRVSFNPVHLCRLLDL